MEETNEKKYLVQNRERKHFKNFWKPLEIYIAISELAKK